MLYNKSYLPDPTAGQAESNIQAEHKKEYKNLLNNLNSLYYLKKEYERDSRKLETLRMQSMSLPQSLTGMPHSQNTSDRVGTIASDIVDLERKLHANMAKRMREEKRISRIIEDIEDPQTRLIFKLRFVDLLDWVHIAFEIGGGNTDYSVKKRCYRHLENLSHMSHSDIVQ